MAGKKFIEASKKVENRQYSISEAVSLLQEVSFANFNETVTVSFHLGVDPRQADQQIRGAMILPNGTGKDKKVLAITNKVEEALAAGADYAGGQEYLDKIKNNWFDFDVIVATPDMMGQLGRLGKILGPKGLMPNPKTGTVSPDIAKAVSEMKGGKVTYRVDKEGNIHIIAGQVKFETEKLVENVKAVCSQILKIKPSAVKGVYVKNCVISSTMGPAISVNPESN